MHQVIAYMYITESKHGGFIHPTDDGEKKAYCIGDLNGYGGTMFCYPVNIPQAVNDFSDFASQIEDEEKLLINHISKKYNTQI